MGIKCFSDQVVFDVLVLGRVPQIFKLPRVGNQVIKLANLLVVIHAKFVFSGAEHGAKRAASTFEVGVQCINVVRSNKMAELIGRGPPTMIGT